MKINEHDRILVVAPHPDDDCIACGGLISLYPSQCNVLLVTDGYNVDLDNLELSKRRYGEFENAMNKAGVNQYWGLHIPEHQIEANVNRFRQIDITNYTQIFVPNRYENHVDHVAVYKVIKHLLCMQGSKAKLWEYEVWTTLRFPNFYLDISNVINQKKTLIEEYSTQTINLDYVSLALGLNSYRGKTKCMDYAEAFYSEKEEKDTRFKSFKRLIKKVLKNFIYKKR